MAKELLDIANLFFFFTIPSSLEAWLCEKHIRSYLRSFRSFRSYFTHPAFLVLVSTPVELKAVNKQFVNNYLDKRNSIHYGSPLIFNLRL
jgi:hypothetical protein